MGQKQVSERTYLIPAVCLGVALVVLGAISAYALNFYARGLSADPSSWGAFGDFLGGVLNPAIALAALVALIYGIKVQREELAAARRTMISTLEQAAAAEKRMAGEQIESLVFRWISLHQEMVNAVSFSNHTGRRAFTSATQNLCSAAAQFNRGDFGCEQLHDSFKESYVERNNAAAFVAPTETLAELISFVAKLDSSDASTRLKRMLGSTLTGPDVLALSAWSLVGEGRSSVMEFLFDWFSKAGLNRAHGFASASQVDRFFFHMGVRRAMPELATN